MLESPAERGKRILEQHETADHQLAKKFDPKEIIRKASEIRTLQDPELGEIKYTPLTTADLFELNRTENRDERAKAMLFRFLQKAYPDLTEEDIEKFPYEVTIRLLTLLTNKTDFLQPETTSAVGSESTEKHNTLAS